MKVIALAYIYQLVKFGDFMGCGVGQGVGMGWGRGRGQAGGDGLYWGEMVLGGGWE